MVISSESPLLSASHVYVPDATYGIPVTFALATKFPRDDMYESIEKLLNNFKKK